jgi:protein-disulfide isomerase
VEVVDEVVHAYADKVRFVHRDFPLPHLTGRSAAEAAACANDQGKFWQYREKLWQSDFVRREGPGAIAKDIGMDRALFDDCLTKKAHAAMIDRDIADARAVGVTSTPTFFINGRPLYGMHPFESFSEIIEQELAWAEQRE